MLVCSINLVLPCIQLWLHKSLNAFFTTHFFISFIEQFADLLIPIPISTTIALIGIFAKSSFMSIIANSLTVFFGHWTCIHKGWDEHWKYVYRYIFVEPRDVAITLFWNDDIEINTMLLTIFIAESWFSYINSNPQCLYC